MNIYRARIFFRKSRDAASFLSLLSFLITGFFLGVRLIRKNRYDIINTHFAVPTGPLGQLLSWMFGIPNVLSLHGGDIYDPSKKMSPHKSPFFKRVVLQMLRRADKVIAQSSNTRDNALNYYQPGREIGIIPLAFHPPVVVKKTRKELGLDRSEFALVSIGRIVKRKALDVLITALASIKDEKIKLHILGDGPERPALEKLAADLGITHRVIFEGFVDNDYKYAMLANADLFTLTSLHEGFGIVFMEAMYCGKPIVCTNHGGQVDFLTHEKNALLIPVGDVEGCAAAITRFRKDKALYEKCAGNNPVKVRQFYAENVAGQYLDVFDGLTSR